MMAAGSLTAHSPRTAGLDTPEIIRDQARIQFQEALSLVPVEQKAALIEALLRSPEVVGAETNPDAFLLSEHYNCWGAAKKYACYWEERKRVFGERFWLPLDLSGEGALTNRDINALKLGVAVSLPSDSEGSPVVFWDRAKIGNCASYDVISRSRVTFFMLHEMAKLEGAQTAGIVAVVKLMKPDPLRNFGESGCKLALDQIASAFPMKLKNIVVFFPPNSSGKMVIFDLLLGTLMRPSNGNYTLVTVNSDEDPSKYTEVLLKQGLSKLGIPSDMGGHWTYTGNFVQWQVDRGAVDLRNSSASDKAPDQKSAVDDLFHFAATVAHDQERECKRKRMGVIYSKRKRIRQKLRFHNLQKEVSEAQARNSELISENERLQKLLKAAEEGVEWFKAKGTPPPDSIIPSLPPLPVASATEESERKREEDEIGKLEHMLATQKAVVSQDSSPKTVPEDVEIRSSEPQSRQQVTIPRLHRANEESPHWRGNESAQTTAPAFPVTSLMTSIPLQLRASQEAVAREQLAALLLLQERLAPSPANPVGRLDPILLSHLLSTGATGRQLNHGFQ